MPRWPPNKCGWRRKDRSEKLEREPEHPTGCVCDCAYAKWPALVLAVVHGRGRILRRGAYNGFVVQWIRGIRRAVKYHLRGADAGDTGRGSGARSTREPP